MLTNSKQEALNEIMRKYDDLLYVMAMDLDNVNKTLHEMRALRYNMALYLNAVEEESIATYTDDAGLK